jgi:hypothetical protein
MSTPYHARYFAHELTRQHGPGGADRLSTALFDACVDLNPHQIDAAAFALRSPLSKGVLLADEVGLGKTIEAGLVLCQCWAERKRRLLVICPASLRKQWGRRITPQAERPSLLRRLLAKARGAVVAVKTRACRTGRWVARTVSGGVKAVKTGVCFGWTMTTAKVTALVRSVPTWPMLAWKLRTPVLLALGVGGTLAVACYLSGPLVASAVSGVAGMAEVLKGKARRLHEQFSAQTTGVAQW